MWKERKKKKRVQKVSFKKQSTCQRKHYSNCLMNKHQLKFLDPVWGTQAFPCLPFLVSLSLLWHVLAACSLLYHLLCRESPSPGDGEMLFCFIVKEQLKRSSSFSVSYFLLLKCPGFRYLFLTPCRKNVFKSTSEGRWDCTGALSATTGKSCFSLHLPLLSVKKKPF